MGAAQGTEMLEERRDERSLALDAIGRRDGDALLDVLSASATPSALLHAACDALDARTLAHLEDLPWVIGILERAVEIAERRDAAAGRCRSLLSLSHALAYATRFDEAIAALRMLVPAARAAGEPLLAARGRVALIHPLSRRGAWAEAIAEGTAGRDELAALAERDGGLATLVAKADANLGVLHKARHDPARALEHFDRALPSFAAIPPALAQIESNRAEALLELGRFEEAEAAFRRSLEALTALGIDRAAAIVEGNLADLLGRMGRLADATVSFERARRRHESVGSLGDVARLRAEQGELFAAAGLLVEARHELAGALDGLVAAGLVAERARACRALVRVHLRLGEPRAAQRLLEAHRWPCAAAETGLDPAALDLERGRWRAVEASALAAAGRHAEALTAMREAQALLVSRRVERCVCLASGAEIALRAGEPDSAAGMAFEAVGIAAELGIEPLEAECLRVRAEAIGMSGAGEAQALADLARAASLLERTRGSLQADRLRSAFAAHSSTVHESFAAALLRMPAPDPARLFAAVEEGRNRSILDRISSAASEEREEEAISARTPDALAYRRLVATVNGQWSRAGEVVDSPEASRWRADLADAEERLRVLEARRWSANGSGGAIERPSTVTLAELAEALPPNAAVVEWCAVRGAIAAVVVRANAARVVRLKASPDDLRDALDACRFQMARRTLGGTATRFVERLRADAIAALRRLDRMLLEPLREPLDAATAIHHVPAGALLGVPFHALHDGERFAIEAADISHSPSASAMRFVAARPPSRGPRVIVGVGDERAPGIEDEARRLAELWPDATLLLGREATVEAVRTAVRGASTVHLAAHGRMPQGSPMSAGVLLADGWWTVREIERSALAGATVVVAACESGRLARTGGDEIDGLVRAFLCAGARELVVSEWAASDRSTRRLMLDAGEALARTPSAAAIDLRSALIAAIRREIARGEHPALWAPFMIYGSPRLRGERPLYASPVP